MEHATNLLEGTCTGLGKSVCRERQRATKRKPETQRENERERDSFQLLKTGSACAQGVDGTTSYTDDGAHTCAQGLS